MYIKITSHKEASEIVSNPPGDLLALVSIYSSPDSRMAAWIDKDQTRPALGFEKFAGLKIALCFDDASVAGKDITLAKESDLHEFFAWADTIGNFPLGMILIHCQAGIARSTSIALALLSYKRGPGREMECVKDIAAIRPQAWFNDHIVSLADQVLDRKGTLIEAVKDWKALNDLAIQ